MQITDLEGKKITVTDLQKAIEQAATYKEYSHVTASPEQVISDKERQLYWTDIHEKLLQLQSKSSIDKGE